MSLNLVRIQIEVLQPGTIIRGKTNLEIYLDPARPAFLYDIPEYETFPDHVKLKSELTLVSLVAIGDEWDIFTYGDLDFMLSMYSEQDLFRHLIPRFKEIAMKEGDMLNGEHVRWCRIAVMEADERNNKVAYLGLLPKNLKSVIE